MDKKKKHISYSEFLGYKERGQVYEGYVIGYGYAFFETVAVTPSHFSDDAAFSFYPEYAPQNMSFHQIVWQQNLDNSNEAIMKTFGENNEYLFEKLIREANGSYYINMGHGEILEVPIEGTTISLETESTGKLTLSIKSAGENNTIEKSITVDMEHFQLIFNNPNDRPYLTNCLNNSSRILEETDSYFSQLDWDNTLGAVEASVGLRGNIPHNELFWRQKNGQWNVRPTTKGNYLYNRSYQLKGQRLSGIKSAGNKLGVLGGVLLTYDIVNTGEFKSSHAISAFMIGISFSGVGAVVSGLWFIADIGTGVVTGKSLSDRADDAFGSIVSWKTEND